MMENLCHELESDLKDAYDKVKWRERVRSWKEVSDPLEKEEIIILILILSMEWHGGGNVISSSSFCVRFHASMGWRDINRDYLLHVHLLNLFRKSKLKNNSLQEVYLFYLIKHLFKNKNTTTANNKKNNGNNENNNSTNNNRNNNVNNNNNNNQTSIIIFCNTCIKTVLISRTLKHLNFNSIFLHGQLSQVNLCQIHCAQFY